MSLDNQGRGSGAKHVIVLQCEERDRSCLLLLVVVVHSWACFFIRKVFLMFLCG